MGRRQTHPRRQARCDRRRTTIRKRPVAKKRTDGHPEAQPIIPEGYEDLLESTALAHIATIGPHGEPQSNPVWFDWDGEHLKFSQTKTRQMYHNVQRNPRIALSMVDPENPFRYLEIRGEFVRIDEDPNLDFINSMAKKYLGMDKYSNHQPGDERVVIFVRPEHTSQMGG